MTLLNKVFGLFGLQITSAPVTTAEAIVESVSTPRKSKDIKNIDTIDTVIRNSEREQRVLKNAVEDIQAQILQYGYKEIPSILDEFETECIAQFVMLQEVSLGSYEKEKDLLESLTRAQLIARALDNNQLQFRQRMFEQGKVKMPSEAQLNKIKELAVRYHVSVDMSKVQNSFDASDLIESLMKKNKVTAPVKTTGVATANQIRAIQNICKKLQLEVASDMLTDFNTASKTIKDLSAKVPVEEPTLATEKQVEYASRLWKMNGHRVTAKKKEAFSAMTKSEISKAIEEMNKEYYTSNPTANEPSKGQLDYIRTLCELTLTPIPAEMPATKDEASKKIEQLNRAYLYILTRITSPSLTKDEINNMNMGVVKELIYNIKLENKTKNYTDNSEGTGGEETGFYCE